VLVVLGSTDEINWMSLRNVPTVHLLERPAQLNTYDVLVADEVVFTTDALEEFPRSAGQCGRRDLPTDADDEEADK